MSLKIFDVSSIKLGDNISIFGKRRGGKSFLVSYLINQIQKINPDVSSASYYDKYDNVFKNMLTDSPQDNANSILVCEEVHERKEMPSEFNTISKKFIFITTFQSLIFLRFLTTNYIFLFNTLSILELNRLYQICIAKTGISFHDFRDLMNTYTENYNCLVIDCKSLSTNLNDVVYYFKAKIPISKEQFALLEEMKYYFDIPPNQSNLPIFKKGGFGYWESWNEIIN